MEDTILSRQEKIDKLYKDFDEILYPRNGWISMLSPMFHPKVLGFREDEPIPTIEEYCKKLSNYATMRGWDDDE